MSDSTESVEVTPQEAQAAEATEGHISQTGGSSPVSFDDFESLDAAEKVEAKMAAKKEAEKEKIKDGKKEESKPKKEAKEQKDAKEAKQEDTGEAGEKSGEDTATEEEGESGETAKNEKVRVYKVNSGKSEVAVRGDTKFKVTTDGQEQEVPLQELMNSWSGHSAVRKRFSELGAEKQKFIEERRVIDNTINELANSITGGEPQKAIMRLFEALGADPVKGYQDLKKSIVKDLDISTLAQLAPEEVEAFIDQGSTTDYKAWYDQQKIQKETEASESRLNSQIERVMREHNIDDATFNKVAEELLTLKSQGRLKDSNGQDMMVTPELIAQAAVYDMQTAQAQGIVKKVNPELTENREAVDKVFTLIKSGMSEDDIITFLKTKYPQDSQDQTQDALSRKIEKTSQAKEDRGRQNPQNEDVWSFDQV